MPAEPSAPIRFTCNVTCQKSKSATGQLRSTRAAWLNPRGFFYRGHVLLDAAFSSLSAMSAAELRELAGVLPRPSGNAANLPPILAFVPRRGYVANTEKYALGPLAFSVLSSPVAAPLVDFAA